MGIQGLTKLLSDECPECMKEVDLKSYTGRVVAIDASMALYQFLIAVRSGGEGQVATMLTNEAGEITSHIQGMFNRTIRLLSSGVRPVYVFDGKPPTLKSGELAARAKKRQKAESDLKNAEESGTIEDIDKFQKRLTKVTSQHTEDVKTLLTFMGVPWIVAPCEAEAQCAALALAGKVYGTATEDMDALTFRTPHLIRRMTFSAAKELPILEISYDKVISGLGITHDQFVDLCILCGCDYSDTIRGVGPKTALKLVREHGSIEGILDFLRKENPKVFGNVPYTWLPPHERSSTSVEQSALDEEKDDEDIFVQEFDSKEDEGASSNKLPDPMEETGLEAAQAVDTEIKQSSEDQAQKEEEGTSSNKLPDPMEETGLVAGQAVDTEMKPLSEDQAQKPEIVPKDEDAKKDQEWIPLYAEARQLFKNHLVEEGSSFTFKWKDPDEEGLTKFLVETSGFNPERVAGGLKKLKASKELTSQRRMDSFFTVLSAPSSSKKTDVKDKSKGASKATAGKKGKFTGKKR